MYLIYSLLFSLGVVLTAPYYLWRLMGKIASGAAWRERFGFLPESLRAAEQRSIWVHAVSVGETIAVAGLVQELQRQYPERQIFLSHTTAAGRAMGEDRSPGVAGRFYLPLDWAWSARRALRELRPALLLIVETELWPNLLRAARESGARVALVNARLSDRSYRRYWLVKSFMSRVLEDVDWVGAQTARDAERFLALGAKPERVVVTGNMKFDGRPPQSSDLATCLKKALLEAHREPVIVAASTMPGEEALLLPAWEEIRRHYPRAVLVLAPRHPARFEHVAKFLDRAEKPLLRRTVLGTDERQAARELDSPEVLLLDTIGELAGIFELASVVFVGGSLVAKGGHNLLEPAYWAKPILFGPHMENFRDIAQLFLEASAAVQVTSPQELVERALEILQDERRRRELGQRAREVLDRESGATRRTLEHLRGWLESVASARAGVPGSEAP